LPLFSLSVASTSPLSVKRVPKITRIAMVRMPVVLASSSSATCLPSHLALGGAVIDGAAAGGAVSVDGASAGGVVIVFVFS